MLEAKLLSSDAPYALHVRMSREHMLRLAQRTPRGRRPRKGARLIEQDVFCERTVNGTLSVNGHAVPFSIMPGIAREFVPYRLHAYATDMVGSGMRLDDLIPERVRSAMLEISPEIYDPTLAYAPRFVAAESGYWLDVHLHLER